MGTLKSLNNLDLIQKQGTTKDDLIQKQGTTKDDLIQKQGTTIDKFRSPDEMSRVNESVYGRKF